ncbi:MAG: M20 family metallo-hydrolase [Gemmatimonadales bacterium]
MRGRFTADQRRLLNDITALAEFGKVGPTAITRLAYTQEDNEAHRHVERLMRDAGMETRYDAFGNLFGRRNGTDAAAKPVVTGSHLDGPPNGGIYDGVIGVLSGIEVCRMLAEAQTRTRRPIEVVAVRCEHLDRFGLSCLGSRAFGGKLKPGDLDRLKDDAGITLRQALDECGFEPERLETVNLKDRIHAWVELHVEQGRVLEDAGKTVGVVTAIAGPTRYKVRIEGIADHSGATPMSIRRDALCGAAEMVLDLERLSRATADCVGTVGIVEAFPGAVHTIPGSAEFYVDIRGVRKEDKQRLVEDFREAMERRARARDLELSVETFVDEDPVPCTDWVIETLTGVCRDLDANFMIMSSGAGHDTQHVAADADVGMFFIPSARGIAHTPDEYTAIEEVAYGAEVLAESLVRLADKGDAERGHG